MAVAMIMDLLEVSDVPNYVRLEEESAANFQGHAGGLPGWTIRPGPGCPSNSLGPGARTIGSPG